jgi:hypothetical protein
MAVWPPSQLQTLICVRCAAGDRPEPELDIEASHGSAPTQPKVKQ